MLDLKVDNRLAFGEDLLQNPSQFGNVPLTIAELVNQAAGGLLPTNLELLIKGSIGRSDTKVPAQDKQRLADSFHHGLGIDARFVDLVGGVLAVCDVGKGYNHARDMVVACAIGKHPAQ